MHSTKSAFFSLLAILLTACATGGNLNLPPLAVVPHVDLQRYVGQWYEIASFPTWFQEGCTATTASYSLIANGDIEVLNQCRKGTLDGELESVRGTAWVVDHTTNAKLAVRFFWPFSGKYWIIDLGPSYDDAAVGHPSRDYLWILSRTPSLDPVRYEEILKKLRQQHYDVDRLVLTRQKG